ncbi:MAG: nitroreductase family protein [Candidatus Hydrogenedentes bacterium]|nr:nitroreductase family protein [Candidatus Hydrogenedentota bacterium]
MEKPADNKYPIHNLLRRRWSPVAFSERPVSHENLRSLLEAARWAPSCYGDQPWSFVVATKDRPDVFDRLLRCLLDANIAWAQYAPVLMISVARRHFAHNGQPNRYGWHDIGLAVGGMLVQATHLGLSVHQMAGFDPVKARETFAIPDDHEPVSAIAIGYRGDAGNLSQALQTREAAPRSRHPLAKFVFSDTWGQVAPFVE